MESAGKLMSALLKINIHLRGWGPWPPFSLGADQGLVVGFEPPSVVDSLRMSGSGFDVAVQPFCQRAPTHLKHVTIEIMKAD